MERANGDPSYDTAMRYAEVGDNYEELRLAWADEEQIDSEPTLPEQPMAWALWMTGPSAQHLFSTPPAAKAPPILRCIFGNPFRPVAFDTRWRTKTVVALANDIYEGRAFDRLPILADALEATGCDNPDVLNHCRGPGPHARGCWVVDLVLGKE